MEQLIAEFITDLHHGFPTNKPISLYLKWWNKNPSFKSHQIPVIKQFLVKNKEAICQQKSIDIRGQITYNQKIHMNVQQCIKDPDTREAILEHLTLIYRSIFPDHVIKERELNQPNSLVPSSHSSSTSSPSLSNPLSNLVLPEGNESKWMNDTMSKLSSQMSSTSSTAPPNPLDFMSLLSQGTFQNLFQDISKGMETGELDPKKFINVAQNMLQQLSSQMDETSS